MLERAGHRLTGVDMLIDSNVPLGSGLFLRRAGGRDRLCPARHRRHRHRPDGARPDQPARRERLRRHALRHHGPVHRLSRGGRPRAPDRLPLARLAPRADRPEGQAGDLQHHGPSRPRRQRIQRPPPRLRARGGTPRRRSPRYPRPSRRQPGRPRAPRRGCCPK